MSLRCDIGQVTIALPKLASDRQFLRPCQDRRFIVGPGLDDLCCSDNLAANIKAIKSILRHRHGPASDPLLRFICKAWINPCGLGALPTSQALTALRRQLEYGEARLVGAATDAAAPSSAVANI